MKTLYPFLTFSLAVCLVGVSGIEASSAQSGKDCPNSIGDANAFLVAELTGLDLPNPCQWNNLHKNFWLITDDELAGQHPEEHRTRIKSKDHGKPDDKTQRGAALPPITMAAPKTGQSELTRRVEQLLNEVIPRPRGSDMPEFKVSSKEIFGEQKILITRNISSRAIIPRGYRLWGTQPSSQDSTDENAQQAVQVGASSQAETSTLATTTEMSNCEGIFDQFYWIPVEARTDEKDYYPSPEPNETQAQLIDLRVDYTRPTGSQEILALLGENDNDFFASAFQASWEPVSLEIGRKNTSHFIMATQVGNPVNFTLPVKVEISGEEKFLNEGEVKKFKKERLNVRVLSSSALPKNDPERPIEGAPYGLRLEVWSDPEPTCP